MARPAGTARLEQLQLFQGGAGTNPQNTTQVLEFFREQKGMDLRQLPDGSARGGVIVEQFEIVDGVLQQAYQGQATAAVGSTQELIAVFCHKTTAGVHQWIFCKDTGIIEIHTNAWLASASVVTATGPAITFNFTTARPTFVSWGDRVLICNGTDGLIDVNVGAGTYAAVAGAPTGRHIAIVGNRVLITGITNQPYRVQWSVKNNYLDWAGLGSGFEDLRDVSLGTTVTLSTIVPYDETFAFLFHDRGVFGIVPTDYYDAPFRFTTLEGLDGTSCPYSVAKSPRGVLYLGNISAWLINRSERLDIGSPIVYSLKHAAVANGSVVGVYDRRRDSYVIALAQSTGGDFTYHCYLGERNQWTRTLQTTTNIVQNLFEYPDVVCTVAGLPRTQYASIGAISGLDRLAFLKREYQQMFESTSDGVATVPNSRFHTPQIIIGDPAKSMQVIELQLVLGVVDGASTPTYSWQNTLVEGTGTETALPTAQVTEANGRADSFVPSALVDNSIPIRWMYTTLAVRSTITSETVALKGVLSQGGTSYGPARLYALRLHVVEGARFNE